MPIFQYQNYRSPFANSIAETMLRRGDIAARQAEQIGAIQGNAAQQSGQAWGSAIAGAGQAIGGALQQANDPRMQLERAQVDAVKRGQQFTSTVNQILTNLTTQNQDGTHTLDRGKLQQAFAAANVPLPLQEQTFKSLDDVDQSIARFNTARTDHLADLAHGVLQAGGTPEALAYGVALAKANGLATDEQLKPIVDAVANGADIKQILTQIRSVSEKYKDVGKPVVVPQEATLASPTGEVILRGTPGAPTEAELALQAAKGDPAAIAAMKTLKPTPNRTSEMDDQKYRDIVAAGKLGKPITPEDAAWAAGYEKQKTLGVDTSASAAATRQANAIAAQTAQQARAQNFTEAQTGRKELTDKVEQPYRQAQQSAQELRDLVHLAQSGNKEAANLQALQATMSIVRANGLNRLNQAEMRLPQEAGSLWDKVQSKVGKMVSGQPIDASLQNDLLDLADFMEKGAYNRYSSSHKDITTRYQLGDEKPVAPPAGYFSVKAPNGKTYTFGSQNDLDAFKKSAGIR